MTTAGIDLGTSANVCAIYDKQGGIRILPNEAGELLSPSAVFFDKDAVLVGTEALNAGLLDPKRLVQNAKRHIGTDTVLAIDHDGKEYVAMSILRILLEGVQRNYQRAVGDVLENAAISVPANFDDRQKEEIKEAAEGAGIKRVIALPHEPTAAICGNESQNRGDGPHLVLDMGGGTTDASLAEVRGDSIDVKATNGLPKLGGVDFTNSLLEIVLERFEKQHGFRPTPEEHARELGELQQRIEQAKRSLSLRPSVSILVSIAGKPLPCEVSRDEFEARTSHLIQQVLDCGQRTLDEARLRPQDVAVIHAVGGASLMPAVHAEIEQRFGRKPSFHGDPHLAVARGALIMGRLALERAGERLVVSGGRLPPLRMQLRDVTAHAFGISLLDDDDNLINQVLLPKGKPIPSEHTASFRLAEPDQRDALITVLQGQDGAKHEDCLELGKFELKELEPVEDGPHKIDVRLRIDRNGQLSAEAVDPNCGRCATLELAYSTKSGEEKP